MPEVSIIIVCMNNLKNLYPCLDSIKKYTNVQYETFVVTYLFSESNLEILKKRYPWVIVVESNEIRGFSENNNLALKRAKGKYCFILNDDTYLTESVIDKLVLSFMLKPDAAIFSPKILKYNGRPQFIGRPKMNKLTFILRNLHLWSEHRVRSKYTNKTGVFQSYNIVGAAFLIRTDVFRDLGFFDERYFFCPEDIAVSTLANKKGYKCYVNADTFLYHLEGGSSSVSMVKSATIPASLKGAVIFYSNGRFVYKFILSFYIFLLACVLAFYYRITIFFNNEKRIYFRGYLNTIGSIFSRKSPKDIFIKYYSNIF